MRTILWGALLAVSLIGCGGGGDDSPRSTPASTVFPLRQAYDAYLSQPNVYSYALSGSCGGGGTETTSAPAAGTFEGSAALVKTSTLRITRDSCVAVGPTLTPVAPPGTEVTVTQQFYSNAMIPLGMRIPDADVTIVWTNTTPMSTTVKVGDSAVLTQGSFGSVTYLVEPDTETSVFVKVIESINGRTTTSTYRLTVAGQFTLLQREIMTGTGLTYVLSPR